MTNPNVLNLARQQLADASANFRPPISTPLNASPWVAMAALQKGIRRGRDDIALRAAATLLCRFRSIADSHSDASRTAFR